MAEPPSLPYRPLGRRIAALRQQRGLTQRDFASAAGISSSYPPKIERGESRPDPAILRRIAMVLDADYEELASLAGYATGRAGVRPDMSLLPVEPDAVPDVSRFARLSPSLRRLALKVVEDAQRAVEEAQRLGTRWYYDEDGRPVEERPSDAPPNAPRDDQSAGDR